MQVEIKVPAVGESITEVEIGQWLKNEGDSVAKDENIVIIETEKATMELPAPAAGVLGKILKTKGATATIGELIGQIDTEAKVSGPAPKKEKPAPAQAAAAPAKIMPAAERVMAEQGVKVEQVTPTGPGGRVLKEDVLKAAEARTESKPAPQATPQPAPQESTFQSNGAAARNDEVVPMSRLRRTLAQRLVEAQQTAALLTTFNEVDMSACMALRKEFQEAFVARYGVKLGFMSFFVKAVVDALKQVPQVNAEIRGTDIVYHRYFDIGVAVGGGKGLVVPVIRNAERLSFSEIELAIADLGKRAKENKIKLEELQGGTFTISNGGVYGSLLSTPIINPPQSGILGMHNIQERPIALHGQVVIRPMMYIALTYDHRIVDGREAVTFLKRVKEAVENPTRMLLEV
ncbi:MAG: 2-oxoglutarate dehydrogenase complex dihydrolipoyllysine-residue succinyltransferase [Verrucomicrobiota bacterium]|nr:2-oxoglutarate dehydrogenase complex dihydrolipoyllysine-residue succinyltransferase [Verrucomicrobiota bacterium]